MGEVIEDPKDPGRPAADAFVLDHEAAVPVDPQKEQQGSCTFSRNEEAVKRLGANDIGRP